MNLYSNETAQYSRGFALDGRRLEVIFRNVSGVIVFCTIVCAFGHTISRLFEQYTLLSNERKHDLNVLRMCAEDRLASESTRMRSMCLQARADTSTPLILAAILKTCRFIANEFVEALPSVYSPYMLMICGTFLPWLLPLLRMCCATPTRIVVDEKSPHVTFIVPTEWNANTSGWGGGAGWGGWKSPKAPPLLNFDCEDGHTKID